MKTPKHQKGSELKARLSQSLTSGLLSNKEARQVKKSLDYLDNETYYFKNADGSYSTYVSDPANPSTDPDKPNLVQTTATRGIRSNSGGLSANRLGIGKDNKGSRKVAKGIGAAMALGQMQSYADFTKPEEKDTTQTDGVDSELTADEMKTMTQAEQDTKFTTDVADIKEEDVKYRTVSSDAASAMYSDAELANLEPTTDKEGMTAYKVPYASIGGAGASQEFGLVMKNGKFELGAPFPDLEKAAKIESSGEKSTNFTGKTAEDYQKHLATLVQSQLDSGDLTDADLSAAGINITDMFNAGKSGKSYDYATIFNSMDANADMGAGYDGTSTVKSTMIDGKLGASTDKLEELLNVTRPSNLVKTTSSGGSGKSGGSTTPAKTGGNSLADLIGQMKAGKANTGKAAGIKKQGGTISRKNGGPLKITFSILNK